MITKIETYIASLKNKKGYHQEKVKSYALLIQQQQNRLEELKEKEKAEKTKHQPKE